MSDVEKVVTVNRKARHDYAIIETYEAGISLLGTEVKALREGRANLKDAYATIEGNRVILQNCHISPYPPAGPHNQHEPERPRPLLLHRREIKRLTGKIKEKGFTLIPTKVLITDKGKVKVEVSLAKGKRAYQKREVIRERDRDREMRTELKQIR